MSQPAYCYLDEEKIYVIFNYVYFCVWVSHASAGISRCQKGVSDPLELEF